ncbi:hypothetical protein Salat_0230800 [Sesamum alatum]|uniref:Uncharacterized protein n=1 Tax=Sesamum alatum TaxID=300844 RepID=A0AAE2CY68_9LAMI|nr:hypothetical protein Salat_0230800 [Sesamum alatum]
MAVISATPTTMSEDAVRKAVTQIACLASMNGYSLFLPIFAKNPPPGCLTVYTAQLTSGLRFSLPRLLVQGFEPSVENFLGALAPKLTTGECFFYLSPHPGLTFIREKPSSNVAWKARFFFIRKAELRGSSWPGACL